MELFEEILLHHLKKNQGAQGFPADPQALVHDTAYQALNAIRIILARDDLEDPECFRRLSLIHIPSPRDGLLSRMPSSA